MKTYVFALTIFLAAATSQAATLNFSWVANPAEDQVTGYRIYQDCGAPECIVAVTPATSYALANVDGDHVYSLAAYRVEPDGTTAESDHSNYVTYFNRRVRPGRPTLKATVTR